MTLIVVSGPPGSGKSTLAGLLSQSLGCPLISRDEIREGVVHAGTPDPDMRHTYRVFTDTVTTLALAGVTVVAEAAFQDHLWRPILAPLLPRVPARVIRCQVTTVTAGARIAARAAAGRAAHQGNPVAADAWIPITLEVPTLTVDTTDSYDPSVAAIVTFAS
ncbi:AAA family ATPase [Actinoplanes sp. NPDC051411]|uniref:AAA family ATPase n=1 Tax=Actinoplanes sp. NPDC051411 TaxID=3155522 RepID=UPI003419886C